MRNENSTEFNVLIYMYYLYLTTTSTITFKNEYKVNIYNYDSTRVCKVIRESSRY